MSLRKDVHSAFDEIAPSTSGLAERVEHTTLVNRAWSPRRLTLHLRVPLSLVAVLVVIAMAVGVLTGERLVRDWNAFRSANPAGVATQSQLGQLESRPLGLTQLNSGAPCPLTSINQYGFYGSGQAGVATGSMITTNWGNYWYLAAVTTADLTGPVLLRGRDLRTNRPLIFVGKYASGPIVGTDALDGKVVEQHLDLVLDTSHPPRNYLGTGVFSWPLTAGLPKGESGCIGWQIDGLDFTYTIVVPG